MKTKIHHTLQIFALAALIVAFPADRARAQAKDGSIECANLIYSGTQTSRCFSDEFLANIQRKTAVNTERRFKPVKLASEELFKFPFVMMTGESEFRFTDQERDNLRRYLTNGGFLLASAGCSSKAWDTAFRREIKSIFTDTELKEIGFEHPIYSTVYKIEKLKLKSGAENAKLEGLDHNGKTVLIYSREGLNDTAHNKGCCCCGGNEVKNSLEVNVNVLAYALMH